MEAPRISYSPFKKMLKEYSSLSQHLLLNSLPDREPQKHLYKLLKIYPSRGGKGLRPALCFASCSAFGGEKKLAIPSATALECLHNAFLIHDDVEDNSDDRRGFPTLNKIYGSGIAVNAGDAMNVLALGILNNNVKLLGTHLSRNVYNEFYQMILNSVEGQAIELGWIKENKFNLSENDYLKMVLKKTCWYTTIGPLRVGAYIGSGGRIELNNLNNFGFYMGVAFQVQDDILNLTASDGGLYGKEIYGDILEGKRTLMLLHLYKHVKESERKKMKKYFSVTREKREWDEAAYFFKLMEKYGSIDYTRKKAKEITGAALKEFYSVFSLLPNTVEKNFIETMIYYMVDRKY